MKSVNKESHVCLLISASTLLFVWATPVKSQILPDQTLPSNSQVFNNGSTAIIEGGTTMGKNLYHSFQDFSVLRNNTAFFNNAAEIKNILSRITGSSGSKIDGEIKSNGTANLYFINPNGIIFGPNARLNVGGSFVATTASSVIFSDGLSYEVQMSSGSPILSVNVPVGLGFLGSPSGSIKVQGQGYRLFASNSFASPILRLGSSSLGLTSTPGKTLALIGSEVDLSGGVVTAPSGRIEVGSIESGIVGINNDGRFLTFDYNKVDSFRNIFLENESLLDTSGSGGSLQIQGRNISLSGGSMILNQNRGSQPNGSIIIQASESLALSGVSKDGLLTTRIASQSIWSGDAGDILVNSLQLMVQDGASIMSATFSSGNSGGISVNSAVSTKIAGFSSLDPLVFSFIAVGTGNTGNAGKVSVVSKELSILEGGLLGSLTFSSGNAGQLSVSVTDLNIDGVSKASFPSQISTSTLGSGNGGFITVNASNTKLTNGGTLLSSTGSKGDAGEVTVNSDFIMVDGYAVIDGNQINSRFSTGSVNFLLNPFFVEILPLLPEPLEELPTGNAGKIDIHASNIEISNFGQIVSGALGTGNAGDINITANNIRITNQGTITNSRVFPGTESSIYINTNELFLNNGTIISEAENDGSAGNIIINAQDISLYNKSIISASTQLSTFNETTRSVEFNTQNPSNSNVDDDVSTGKIIINVMNKLVLDNSDILTVSTSNINGGNINILANDIVIMNGSSISTSSTSGLGGSIFITSPALLVSPDSTISATGGSPDLNGTVEINTQDFRYQDLLTIPAIDQTLTPRDLCKPNSDGSINSFSVTGRGGIPQTPADTLYSLETWSDPAHTDSQDRRRQQPYVELEVEPDPIEAQRLVQTPDGRIVLTADSVQTPYAQSTVTCDTATKP
jgi:filamentous hemagglutinin family protein